MNGTICLCFLGLLTVIFLCWLVVRSIEFKEKPIEQRRKIFHSYPKEGIREKTTKTSDRFIEVIPGIQQSTPNINISYSFERNESSFIRDSKKYHSIEGKPVPSIPFMEYWPTFQSLNPDQKKWYFFWRSEVRQGRFPDTDLSYIFIYVYELLCLVEILDPFKATEQIKKIWKAYRSLYPKLDNYLPDWGGDLATTKVGLTQGIAWWWELMTQDKVKPPAAFVNIFVQKAVDTGKMKDLPYDVWAGLNYYHPQNKFYQRFNQNGAIDQSYLKAIYSIDDYLSNLRSTKGLLDRYTPPRFYPQTKAAFSSAIVPDDYPKQVIIGEARNFAGSSRLGNLLAAITKYSENILRKQNRFSARLSGFELEEKFRLVLDKAFIILPEKEKEAIHITLDKQRITVLQEESVQVSEMLEHTEEQVGKPMYSDIIQVRSLWEKLDLPSRKLLLAIYSHQLEDISQFTSAIIGTGTSLFVLIDQINNLSLILLGDRIISLENRKNIMIADDFIDEMELIAKENPIATLLVNSTKDLALENVDPWQCFLNHLSLEENELLSKIVSMGSLQEAEIEAFTRSHGQMGSLMIDSISEKAIEYLGRTPFYQEDSRWLIEEEEINVLQDIIPLEGVNK